MLTFKSPDNLYQIEYPKRYNSSYQNDILSITPPKESSCLTISKHHFLGGINDLEFVSLFQKLTLKYEAIQDPVIVSEHIILQRLKNIRPNNQGNVITTYWTICIYRKHEHVLVISVNVPGEEDQEVFTDYEQMMNSISL